MADIDFSEDAITDADWAAAAQEQALAEAARNAAVDADMFPTFDQADAPSAALADYELILDIPVTITVELGRTRIAIRNLLQLAQGSVVELDALAGQPLDVLVNGTLIARGEVVVVNEKFGIRLTEILAPSERVRKLRS